MLKVIKIAAAYQMLFLIIPAQFNPCYPKPKYPVIAFQFYMCVIHFCIGVHAQFSQIFYLVLPIISPHTKCFFC